TGTPALSLHDALPISTRSEGVEKFLADIAKSKSVTPAEVEQEFFRTVRPSSLLQRFETTDEVAAMVAFVASPLSSATNGAALRRSEEHTSELQSLAYL